MLPMRRLTPGCHSFIPRRILAIFCLMISIVLTMSTAIGALLKWQRERGHVGGDPGQPHAPGDESQPFAPSSERIIVFNKRDLVPSWGIEVRTPSQKLSVTCYGSMLMDFSSYHPVAVSQSSGEKISWSDGLLFVNRPHKRC